MDVDMCEKDEIRNRYLPILKLQLYLSHVEMTTFGKTGPGPGASGHSLRTLCVWGKVSVSSGVPEFESGFSWFSQESLSCPEVSEVNLLHRELESRGMERD